jgi:hypothetical protein
MNILRIFTLAITAYSIQHVQAHLVVTPTNATFNIRLAAFGTRLNHEGLSGWLESVTRWQNETHGCKSFTEKVPERWIALVERGECSFVEKVRAMQASGAVAVVVGDNQTGNLLLTMFSPSDASDIHVPSVFMTQTSYRDLRFQLATNHGLPVVLYPSQAPLLFSMIMMAVTFPFLVIGMVYLAHLVKRRRHLQSLVATTVSVDALPTRTFHDQDPESGEAGSDEVCAICLEDFVEGDVLRVLRCNHAFHPACIDPWLTQRKRTCPCCKQDALEDSSETSPLLSASQGPIVQSRLGRWWSSWFTTSDAGIEMNN